MIRRGYGLKNGVVDEKQMEYRTKGWFVQVEQRTWAADITQARSHTATNLEHLG